MKQRKSRLHHDTLARVLKQHFPVHATRLTVLCAVVLAMIRARSVVLYSLITHLELPGYRAAPKYAISGLNAVLAKTAPSGPRRFVQFALPDTCLAALVLGCLPRGKQWLILDRTHCLGPTTPPHGAGRWKLGKMHINILLLSAVWKGFSLPLVWTVLSTGGNSIQTQRITLLERVQSVLPAGDTLGMLGDREFIGSEWFTFLRKQGVEVCIRLKKDARAGWPDRCRSSQDVDNLPVQACFLNMKPGELRVWREQAR